MRKFVLSMALAVALLGTLSVSTAEAQRWRSRWYSYPSTYYYSYPSTYYSYPSSSYYYYPDTRTYYYSSPGYSSYYYSPDSGTYYYSTPSYDSYYYTPSYNYWSPGWRTRWYWR